MTSLRLPHPVLREAQSTVLGTRVTPTSHDRVMASVANWVAERTSRYICFCNVHMVMEGHDDQSFQLIVNQADLVAPDGMPIVWYLRRHGFPNQEQVTGPDLMCELLREAASRGWRIGLLGGEPETLKLLCAKSMLQSPELKISYSYSPVFTQATANEDDRVCKEIEEAKVQVLLVGLGCPKQERWMAEHVHKVNCVMLGVGAAFQLNSGKVKKAPKWIQRLGMEWLFRLAMEPRRLWRRYAKHNPRFIAFMGREAIRERFGAVPKSC
jgi:N-acetylglucosaminyldiphosphoundecaprenol N-acetyl-beta-D-mannosaminyltransferase